MALFNSEAYGDLSKVSSGQSKRQQGKFFSVFITGEPREGQQFGLLQCVNNPEVFNDNYKFKVEDFIYNNANPVFFIPLFIKRYWEKTVRIKNSSGEFDQLVAFGWNDDQQKIDDQCKFVYTIAGLALDSNTKKVIVHPKDIEAAEIKKGDKVLIHFRCSGVRFTSAMKLLDDLATKAKTLEPLSNNIEFEQLVVTPKRFIIAAGVTTANTAHGNKNIYKFEVSSKLPDNTVENIMKTATELQSDFEKQFNKSTLIRSAGSTKQNIPTSTASENPAFDESVKGGAETKPTDEFDLGI